jgi:ABC-2 type transport system ATP-binding protein
MKGSLKVGRVVSYKASPSRAGLVEKPETDGSRAAPTPRGRRDVAAATVLVTTGLTKFYGKRPALSELDLQVRAGEVFGFLGPNGAGKTTTIRLLLDLIRPTAGEARIFGLDSRRDTLAIRRRIGYVPGDLALYPELTGHQLIEFFAGLRGGVDEGFVDHLASELQLDLTQEVGALSTGNRQKLGLVQALMHRPELLILDEPTRGLDPMMQHKVQEVLRQVAIDGRTVFLSSHVLSEVERVADRVGILRDGRLVAVETMVDLKRRAVRRMDVTFDGAVGPEDLAGVPGVRVAGRAGPAVRLVVEGSLDSLIKALAQFNVSNLVTHEPDLEEIFMGYYGEEGSGDAA